MVCGQPQVDVTAGVHPQSVGVADLPPGEHRSVAIAKELARRLGSGLAVSVRHRDIAI